MQFVLGLVVAVIAVAGAGARRKELSEIYVELAQVLHGREAPQEGRKALMHAFMRKGLVYASAATVRSFHEWSTQAPDGDGADAEWRASVLRYEKFVKDMRRDLGIGNRSSASRPPGFEAAIGASNPGGRNARLMSIRFRQVAGGFRAICRSLPTLTTVGWEQCRTHVRVYLTVRVPSMPASRWPGTEQKKV